MKYRLQRKLNELKQHLPWNKLHRRKQKIRSVIEQQRRCLSVSQMMSESDLIMDRIEQLPEFIDAKFVVVYFPIHHEISLLPLVERYRDEKIFLFPVTHNDWLELRPYAGLDNMKEGKFGVPEPQSESYEGSVDLILVPGVAFDHYFNRLGRGGGYYDRFLRRQRRAQKIGVAYDFQVMSYELPHSWLDTTMDGIITPNHAILK